MKLFAYSKIRNEIDIIEPFLLHLDALFDKIYLLDHKSKDGTTEILKSAVKQRPGWEYIYLDFNGYFQKEASNFMIRKAFKEGADFLFVLDADEFLFVKNRIDLERRLKELIDFPGVGKFLFRGVIPSDITIEKYTPDTEFWIAPSRSKIPKVVIPRKTYESFNHNITVIEGNHEARDINGYCIKTKDLGDIVHFYERSREQFERKFIIGTMAIMANGNRNPLDAGDYFRNVKAIANHENISSSALESELINSGFQKVSLARLNVPFSNTLSFDTTNRKSSLAILVADALVNYQVEFMNNAELVLSDGIMKIVPSVIPHKPKFFNNLLNTFRGWRKLIPPIMKERISQNRIKKVIYNSGLFDLTWYYDTYMKSEDSRFSPLEHFLLHGAEKRLNPSPAFDSGHYMDEYPDVHTSGMNPLVHYLLHGKIEQRSIFPVFDPEKITRVEKIEGINYLQLSAKKAPDTEKVDLVLNISGESQNLFDCLDSLNSCLRPGDRLIIVLDAANHEQLNLQLPQFSHADQFTFLETPYSCYSAKAYNLGLSTSTAENIIFLDSKTIVHNSLIPKLAAIAGADPDVGIVSALFSPLYHFSFSSEQELFEETYTANTQKAIKIDLENINYFCEQWSLTHGHAIVPFMDGHCFLVKKDLFQKIGNFDDLTYMQRYGEAADYCCRAAAIGYKTVVATNVYVQRINTENLTLEAYSQPVKDSIAFLKHKFSHARITQALQEIRGNPVLDEIHRELLAGFNRKIFRK